MKVWVFVEGRSDVGALEALWGGWRRKLGDKGWGVKLISLDNKPKYLKKIGDKVAEKLVHDECDVAVGLPDFYPNREFANTEQRQERVRDLRDLQTRLVRNGLEGQGVRGADVDSHLARFYASAMKHDMEVLLLAATSQLRSRLNMSNEPGSWQRPPEKQNQERPPKRIVEELFKRHLKRSYREITDGEAILRNADLHDIAEHCPTFGAMIDWIGGKTHVPGY